jgi:hypothetical protein
MTQEDVGAMPDVVAGTLQLSLIQVYALLILGPVILLWPTELLEI